MAETVLQSKYTIRRILCSDNIINCYIVNRNDMEMDRLFLINEFVDRSSINLYIESVLSLKNGGMTDFIECFTENSKLYTVFSYSERMNLKKVFATSKFPFEYRISVIEKILEKIIDFSALDEIFKRHFIHAENILFDDNFISFQYRIFGECDENMYIAFKKIMDIVFTKEEIAKNAKLRIVQEKCEKNVYHSFGEVRRDLEDVLKNIDKDKDLKAFALEKSSKFKKKLVQIGTICIILGAIWVVYDRYISSNKAVEVFQDTERIGTVDVCKKEEEQWQEQVEKIYIHNELATEKEEAKPVEPPKLLEEVKSVGPLKSTEEVTLVESPKSVKTYVVQKNDNLTKIVINAYGSKKNLKKVIDHNKLERPSTIYKGQVIELPDFE